MSDGMETDTQFINDWQQWANGKRESRIKFRSEYYLILEMLQEDRRSLLETGQLAKRKDFMGNVVLFYGWGPEKDTPVINWFIEKMKEAEHRTMTAEECREARRVCGTWGSMGIYFREYCMPVAYYWEGK